MGIEFLYLCAEGLALASTFLFLVELLVGHLHALQLQRQLLVAAVSGLHHLGLVVEDALDLCLGGLELQFLAEELVSGDGGVLVGILVVLHLLVEPCQSGHVLVIGAEDVLGDVERTLVQLVGLTLRLVQLLLLGQLTGDGVGCVAQRGLQLVARRLHLVGRRDHLTRLHLDKFIKFLHVADNGHLDIDARNHLLANLNIL